MRTRTVALITAAGLAALLGAACGSDGDDPTIGAGSGSEATTEGAADVADAPRNDADVTFARMMIPHHEQAVEMAQLAQSNAGDERVTSLAAEIEAAQAPEIELLSSWLEAWGEDTDMGGMDHGEDGGMMSEDDMAALEEATGADFDRMFLEMMVEHHRGAVEMAETEIADGEFPDAIELAETIKATQEGEIAEMEELLVELGA